MNKLLFPRATFADLFSKWGKYDTAHGGKPEVGPRMASEEFGIPVGGYCSISLPHGRYKAMSVYPSDAVYEAITKWMIPVPHDKISFEIVCREDGSALIVARNGQILADLWLAILPTNSIPGLENV